MQKPELEQTEKELRSGLYIVATPIGSLRDITLRALDVLRQCDYILCEDSRVTGKLLAAHGIKKETRIYNDHSDEEKRLSIINALDEGKVIALVSDAGSPLVSDPGYKLTREVRKGGIYITSVPGPCAPIAAVQLSGMPSDKFSFLGFLPPKTAGRNKLLEQWKNVPSSLIVFETAPRLLASLRDICAVMKGRKVAVIREITKLYEEVQTGDIEQVVEYYKDNGAPKGEIVIVIEPPLEGAYSEDEIKDMLRTEIQGRGTKDAASIVADKVGISKKQAYDMAIEIVKEQD
tara:strand:- start:996 stop:1865 length:870 start_codon:yes stop_codon:yes gene_type:complete